MESRAGVEREQPFSGRRPRGHDAEQLREPGPAFYFGLFLTAESERFDGRKYHRIGAARKLLPEERALLVKVTGADETEFIEAGKSAPR